MAWSGWNARLNGEVNFFGGRAGSNYRMKFTHDFVGSSSESAH